MLSTSRAGPDQALVGLLGEDRNGVAHDRHWIPAGVGDPSGEDRDEALRASREAVAHPRHLLESHERRDVELHAGFGETPYELGGGLTGGVGDGNLHEHVLAPTREFKPLPFHLVEVVAEHLEGDRSTTDESEGLPGEALVVGHTGLPHQRRVRGEARDPRLRGELLDAGQAGAVGE